jgi:hypothetical protein
MYDLRMKAQELLQVRQDEEKIKKNISTTTDITLERNKSKKRFIEKIQNEINYFQNNLLKAADKGQLLKIIILQLNSTNLLSWWNERDKEKSSYQIHTEYTPIESGIITFIDDVDLEQLTDDIILDSTLQKLYDIILENDIYPEWKVKIIDGKIESLYLEINPLISYKEKKEILRQKKIKKQQILMLTTSKYNKVAKQNIKQNRISNIVIKIKTFITIFIPLLYLSVTLLTILSSALELTPSANNSFTEIAWPYFLFFDFQNVGELFIISVPLGILIAYYSTFDNSTP